MTDHTQPIGEVHFVVGFDDSDPAERALGTAIRLMAGRTGRIEVVYVAHMPSAAMLSADALGEVAGGFDELETELRAKVDAHLRQAGVRDWGFVRRDGMIPDELISVAHAVAAAHPDQFVALVVGSSSHALHRVVGSVAVNLARRADLPVVVVP